MNINSLEDLIYMDKSIAYVILMSLEIPSLKEISKSRYFLPIKEIVDLVIILSQPPVNRVDCADRLAASFMIKDIINPLN
jgi:hypothetical protein